MKTEELKQQITNAINNAGVGIDTVYYLMKDIFHEVEVAYSEAIRKELETKQNSDKEDETKDKEES